MTETLYKVLNEDGSCYHGGTGAWPLPQGDAPGTWLEVVGEIVPCCRGLHVCRIGDLFDWFGPAIWTVEATGVVVERGNKLVVACARLLQRTPWSSMTARLFAADCAERALPLFERARPNDSRPRAAIEMARRHAHGEATGAELDAAGAAAADAYAYAATDDAAYAAAIAAWTAAAAAADDAAYAAAAAAWNAAAAAADAAGAAGDAAGAAERAWQTERLRQYLTGGEAP